MIIFQLHKQTNNTMKIYRNPEDDKTPIGGGGGSPKPRGVEEEDGEDKN